MSKKIERNDPCWCGSGKKYKKCHEAFDEKMELMKKKGYAVLDHDLIKTPAQIEKIKESCKINIAVLDYVAEHIGPGVTTQQIDDWVHEETVRHCGDDPAVIGGVAFFHGQPVTVLAQEKGEGTKENITRNFGMVSPEGYWKSLRLMQQAEKFHRPVICLVDTPGAFCGLEAEERGQGEAIAKNLYTLAGLTVPVLSVVIGEGGSGGALALAVADEVWMLEHSVYSILSPEGFASILWKDSKKAKEAAAVMKLTAADLYQMGMIEHVIPEAEPVSRENINDIAGYLENGIADFLEKYGEEEPEKLLEHRYERFRKM